MEETNNDPTEPDGNYFLYHPGFPIDLTDSYTDSEHTTDNISEDTEVVLWDGKPVKHGTNNDMCGVEVQ